MADVGGKYKTYAEYKDSGVEWLGLVPLHWEVKRLKHMAQIQNGQDYKAVEAVSGYPVLGSGGQFTFATEFLYDKESVLLGRKGTIDKPLYIKEPFWTVDTMYYTKINSDVPAKYLHYLALTIQFDRYSTNTALPSMTQEHLGNYAFGVPPEEVERSQIANFLDHETAKIDTLIEEQKTLIRLLQEKRQAVISHAVTKGLNPDAPMKDSGVEWLGEVPEHWSVCRLKNTVEIAGRIGFRGYNAEDIVDEGEGAVVLGPSNINGRGFSLEKQAFLSWEKYYESPEIMVEDGDILLAKTSWSFGKVAVIPKADTPMTINPQMVLLKRAKIDSRYLSYFLGTDALQACIFNYNTGSYMPTMTQENISNLPIFAPPKNEVSAIVQYLEEQVQVIDALIDEQHIFSKYLQERRAALISATVTGKIDVRDWTPTAHPQQKHPEAPHEQTA
ncbi:restriction endonuclease subunit S [Endozoicomonas sp. ALE010]|uniref:restriction endonuclease subunit S n=1 Tax=Endozoicomonas sp. ALE010 TaxID=3403081 RepID=UPI003BB7CBA2